MQCKRESLKTYLWKHKFLPALGNKHMLPHWFQGNKNCATPKSFTVQIWYCLRHQGAFLPPVPVEALPSVTQRTGVWLGWTTAEESTCDPTSQGGPQLLALDDQCAQAEQKLPLGEWHKTQLGGKQVKTDAVKGIQISSIFQARSQDTAHF